MKLKVLGSGSKGNCYLLQNDNEILMLEAGVPFREVLSALGGNIRKVKGCLITHEHGDHAKFVKEALSHGIKTYMTPGTREYIMEHHRMNKILTKPIPVEVGKQFKLGGFTILPFNTVHDAAEPCGFLINHPEMGTTLFATDTRCLPNTFAGLSNVMIECNYDEDRLQAREDIPDTLKDRIRESHMSVDTCIGALQANDLVLVNNIILVHVSDGDGDPEGFEAKVAASTGKRTACATRGLEVEFNKTPF